MMKFTFDTNCVIDVDEKRAPAASILEVVAAHRDGRADTAFVAVSASERQLGDRYLDTYDEFVERLQNLGLDDIPQIPGLAYWDISYWHQALRVGDDETRERQIHNILFPGIEFLSLILRGGCKFPTAMHVTGNVISGETLGAIGR